MKVYIIKEEDFQVLCAAVDRDPRHGQAGGSSQVLSAEEARFYMEAHRFFNYQVRTWIDRMKQS